MSLTKLRTTSQKMSKSPHSQPSLGQPHLLLMDQDSAGATSEECDPWPLDDEQMVLLIASLSPSRMISPCLPWSPTEFFERMPPSPVSPVGFMSLWNFDDERMSPLQMPPSPERTIRTVAAPSSSYDANTDSTSNRVGHLNDKWQFFDNDLFKERLHTASCLIKDRLTLALRYFKESTDQHMLVQVWAPVKSGDRYVLTTSGQPFVLDHQSIGLLQYRAVSMMYMYSTDGSIAGELGLPGQVYKQKVPEWTPNVQYYSSTEYPPLNHAICYNVRGTVALPVFDPETQSCIAVVELIMTAKKINYADEVDKICKALEAVNLKSTEILDHPNVQIFNEGRQSALVEILEILTVICEEHKLPLAQTWVPCKYRSVLAHGGGIKSCLSFDGSCRGEVCASTSDVAFHVIDAHMWGFRDACVEHHLQKGQGVSGKALLYHRPCFSSDVKEFCKLEYPLVHYARMFGLTACFAVCLRSSYTGNDDYVLEFFLPPNCQEDGDQKALLESILDLMKQAVHSLKLVGYGDLDSLQVSDILVIENEETKEEDAHISRSGRFESLGCKTNPTKSRAKSGVWKYFRKDGARAYCKRCNKDYAADSRRNGTSRLLRHLKDAHSLMEAVDGNLCEDFLQVGDIFVKENKELKEIYALTESRGNNGKAASIVDVQHHFSGEPTNAAKSRGKSEVWQHFRKDGFRAYCKLCNNDYAADPKKDGTSRLWRHLENAHKISKASSAKNEKSGINSSCPLVLEN